MGPLKRVIRPVARVVSPRHRRWYRFLRSFDFDPDTVDLEPPTERDFIICGASRTGTSLLTAQLFQPPRVVTVMEPWEGLRSPPSLVFSDLRAEVAAGTLRHGRLDIAALQENGSVRWCRDGEKPVPIVADPDHLLGIKWPVWWRYLDRFPETRFLVCVRDPLETIASFKRSGGRLGEGLNYDVRFNATMNAALQQATDDVALRRVLLYDYINERIVPHLDDPNVFVVRYERWFEDPLALLSEMGAFLGEDLSVAPVSIRPPKSRPDELLSPREMELIATRCRTGPMLGYPR